MSSDISDDNPWDRKDLKTDSALSPKWHDPAKVIEQAIVETEVLKKAEIETKLALNYLEAPISETCVNDLSFGQKLVALLLSCGASTLDIALDLKVSAEKIHPFENNKLIIEQITIYKERFLSSDYRSKIDSMFPEVFAYVQKVIKESGVVDEDKKLELAKWFIDKITGKAAQQINVTNNLNYSHLLEEMKRMREAREAIASGAQHSMQNSHTLIDVTPRAPQKDKYQNWLSEWEKENE